MNLEKTIKFAMEQTVGMSDGERAKEIVKMINLASKLSEAGAVEMDVQIKTSDRPRIVLSTEVDRSTGSVAQIEVVSESAPIPPPTGAIGRVPEADEPQRTTEEVATFARQLPQHINVDVTGFKEPLLLRREVSQQPITHYDNGSRYDPGIVRVMYVHQGQNTGPTVNLSIYDAVLDAKTILDDIGRQAKLIYSPTKRKVEPVMPPAPSEADWKNMTDASMTADTDR